MICQECNERPATLHFTNFSNGEKTEMHLCERCAQEKGEMFMMNQGSGFSINNLLAGLLNMEPAFQTKAQEPFPQEPVHQCDKCSMTFRQFVRVGRFGCANCYEAFREQLIPVIRRLHSGNTSHKGKIPKRVGGHIQIQRNISELRMKLNELVTKEEFEEAVRVRDEIRMLEKTLSDKRKGGA